MVLCTCIDTASIFVKLKSDVISYLRSNDALFLPMLISLTVKVSHTCS